MPGYPYGPWRLAGSVKTLQDAVNAHWPGRDHASDGTIGDARHAGGGPGHAQWTASDHNPWVQVGGVGVVRAIDITAEGIDAPWLAEQIRIMGAHGDPRLRGGGYVIYNRQITAPDFSHWTPYSGADPHTTHVHVSVTRDPAGFDYTGPWSVLAACPGPAVPVHQDAPAPAHAAPAGPNEDAAGHLTHPTGHDATGHGDAFRAEVGDAGPEIAHLQEDLNRYAPAYSHLMVDGEYGDQTAAVVREFAHREATDPTTPAPPADVPGLLGADGENVGPRLARALRRDGIPQ